MGISDKLHGEGGYVFVSHSHLDIQKVREIRNLLEEKGFEPILFYLKSLDDGEQETTDFLRSLIYNEIDAREFFLYLDSENARESQWVNEELNYIKENAPYKLTTVDLNDDKQSIAKKIEALAAKMRIFLSYSRRDTSIALEIAEKLKKADFRVYDDMSFGSESNLIQGIKNAINEASEEGIILILVSKNSLQSEAVSLELSYALSINARVVPVFIDDCYIEMQNFPILNQLGSSQCRISEGNCEPEQMKKLIERLREIR